MAVSESFREYVLEQLGRVSNVRARRMFGGVGIYANAYFFAIIADDTLYFKVDDSNRSDFEAAGMGPFLPYGDPARPMGYYAVPIDVLEDVASLSAWAEKAIAVARTAAKRKRPIRGVETGKGREPAPKGRRAARKNPDETPG